MHILALLELAAQIYCIVHCIQRRKSTWWVFLILFVPVIGCIVYFITEIRPDQQRGYSRGTANANPLRYRPARQDISRLRQEIEFSNTVQNKENLADALCLQGDYAEAVNIYQSCLQGFNDKDLGILYKLAEAAFAADDYDTSLQALHKIRALSDYRASKVRLLLARNYAGLGQHDKAREAFLQALEKHSDLEIPYRYAEYLYTQQDLPAAMSQLTFIEQTVSRMPRHAQKLNKTWIQSARKAQKALQQELG